MINYPGCGIHAVDNPNLSTLRGTIAMEKHSIFLVDNDPATACFITQALESKGYQVTTASDGEAALDLISRNGFDLVLTDMIMEPVDGPEILRKAKEIDPDTMVMILNGRGDGDLAGDALKNHADEYLYKPPDLGNSFLKLRRAWIHCA